VSVVVPDHPVTFIFHVMRRGMLVDFVFWNASATPTKNSRPGILVELTGSGAMYGTKRSTPGEIVGVSTVV
jgi:hypothetical protein